jgi:ceramide glucosyltransferase
MSLMLLASASITSASHGSTQEAQTPSTLPPDGWPSVSVIVPVTGAATGMGPCLTSVIEQDYPCHEVIFVTRKDQEDAVPLIRALIKESETRGYARCRHVVSGDARTCGQKNHNLLAGLATVGPDQDILVFCDASHIAPSHWLKGLVGRIARHEAAVTTGYHHVMPGNRNIAAWGRAVTVSVLYRLQGISLLTQPWGGNTAIRRSVFDELNIANVWATNVVDDVSLAARLKQAGIKVKPIDDAALSTPLLDESLAGWSDWLTRQLLYLKFGFPGSWVAAGLVLHILAVLLVMASISCIAALAGLASYRTLAPALSFLLLVSVSGEALRRRHPSLCPRPLWLAALFTAALMGCLCHIRSWFAREIHWRRISYRVTWGGIVEEIKEPAS